MGFWAELLLLGHELHDGFGFPKTQKLTQGHDLVLRAHGDPAIQNLPHGVLQDES